MCGLNTAGRLAILGVLLIFAGCASASSKEPTRAMGFEGGWVVLTNDPSIPAAVCGNAQAYGCYERSTKTLYCLYSSSDVCWHEFLHHLGVLDADHHLRYDKMTVITASENSKTVKELYAK